MLNGDRSRPGTTAAARPRSFVATCGRLLVLLVSTVVLGTLITIVGTLADFLPTALGANSCRRCAERMALLWQQVNNRILVASIAGRWTIEGVGEFDRTRPCVVISNHCGSVDIAVLQHVLSRVDRFPKFFVKREFLAVPVMGVGCRALGMPMLRRGKGLSPKAAREATRRDLEEVRRCCDKVGPEPAVFVSFLEGTRHQHGPAPERGERPAAATSLDTPGASRRGSDDTSDAEYRYLLRPKTAGLAVVLEALGSRGVQVVDATLVYPDGVPGIWALLGDEPFRIGVKLRSLTIPESLDLGRSQEHESVRIAFRQWIESVWAEKDETIEEALKRGSSATLEL